VKVKYVAQEQEHGCVVACIAMVLGWDYGDVADYFQNDFDKSGVKLDFAKTFICEHGFSVIEKRPEGFMDIKQSNKRMLEPFAQIHIVGGSQFIDAKHNHAFVMDKNGKTWNPGNQKHPDPMNDYYSINRVCGFWRENS